MSHNFGFDANRWQTVKNSWIDWWEGRLDRPLVVCEGYQQPGWLENHPAGPKKPNWTFAGKYPLDMPVETVLDRYQEILDVGFFLGDAMPKFYVNIGPGVLAAFLGGQYQILPDTTWFSPPVTQEGRSWETIPLEELHLTLNQDHPLWRRICDLTTAAIARWNGSLIYGITDIGGNLDVLASLIGAQRLAMELLDNPAEIERLCGEIRQAWLECYERMYAILEPAGMGCSAWACVWAPGRMYMFQSDFAYMISPALFRRLVIPDLEACCQAVPYAFYHLDGQGQIRHLDQLLALEGLRGIQWVSGDGAPPAEEWMPLLKRIRQGGKLCQVYASADGARRIIDELGGKGFVFDINDNMTPEQAERLVEELTDG